MRTLFRSRLLVSAFRARSSSPSENELGFAVIRHRVLFTLGFSQRRDRHQPGIWMLDPSSSMIRALFLLEPSPVRHAKTGHFKRAGTEQDRVAHPDWFPLATVHPFAADKR